MQYLIYTSRALIEPGSPAAAAIYLAARRKNAKAGITGYLHFEDDRFVQYIEGRRLSLTILYNLLLCDPRHTDLRILSQGSVAARRFEGWDMAVTDEETLRFSRWSGGLPIQAGLDQLPEPRILDFLTTGLETLKTSTAPAYSIAGTT